MNLLKTRLSFEDFLLEMLRIPSDRLYLERLQDWIDCLDLRDELFRHHIQFCSQGYQRRLLCRTPRFDLLILCWQPGQASSIHDHADSLNVTRVYRGTLTARTFEPIAPVTSNRCCPNNRMAIVQEQQLSKNQITAVDRYQIHQLANTSDENLVTLHLYARPLHQIQVYCPQTGQVSALPIHYDAFD